MKTILSTLMELNRRLDIASQHIFFEARDHQRRF